MATFVLLPRHCGHGGRLLRGKRWPEHSGDRRELAVSRRSALPVSQRYFASTSDRLAGAVGATCLSKHGTPPPTYGYRFAFPGAVRFCLLGGRVVGCFFYLAWCCLWCSSVNGVSFVVLVRLLFGLDVLVLRFGRCLDTGVVATLLSCVVFVLTAV